ncbi:MAG: hypothetical protein FJ304_16635 [Planctomycetes bacterium]|nr:hypothetical protein [Planctomycetota bacterium]
MSRYVARVALFLLVLGCGKKADEPPGANPKPSDTKPDVTMPIEDYLTEYRGKEKETQEKYKGKLMEFSATVWSVRDVGVFGRLNVIGGHINKLPLIQSIPVRDPEGGAGKEKELRLLARGQKVTIRARVPNFPTEFGLEDLKIIDSTPTQVFVTTVADIVKAEADKDAIKKFREREFMVRVTVKSVHEKDVFQFGEVTDAGAPVGAPAIRVRRPLMGMHFKKEFEALKVGDTVWFLAGLPSEQEGLELRDARIVKEAPAGITLPPAK